MSIFAFSKERSSRSSGHFSFRIIQVAVILLSTLSFVAAYELEALRGVELTPFYQELERRGEIHIDLSPPPMKRAVSDSSSNTASATASASTVRPTRPANSTMTGSAGPASETAATATLSSSTSSADPTTLPTPFDTSLGNNFTVQSCPTFFNAFMNNATFKSCLPVSLLLQNSMQFLKGFKSALYMDKVLDSACGASLAICSPLMSDLADGLIDDANCGQDYRRQNPLVMQAYVGLLAYEPLYNATCVENKSTSNYCFVDAIVNTTNAADLYPYYIALGVPLPTSAQPTCSLCLQKTMNIFAGYAGQKNQPLAKTYIPAAQQIDSACGTNFVPSDIKASSKNAASGYSAPVIWLIALTAVSSWLVVM